MTRSCMGGYHEECTDAYGEDCGCDCHTILEELVLAATEFLHAAAIYDDHNPAFAASEALRLKIKRVHELELV